MPSSDTAERAHKIQREIYQKKTPLERLQIGLELSEISRSLMEVGIRRQHPSLTTREVKQEILRRSRIQQIKAHP